ncbi:MAG: DUF2855 family protein [Mycobacteriaceae bacterium]
MTAPWDLLIARDDPSTSELREASPGEPGPGEALLRMDRAGVTANNVTYAVLGDTLRYWEFFPAPHGWGRVPLWGFAEVAASRAEGVEVGQRVYGFLPSSSHLLVSPSRVGTHGFRDAAEQRAGLSAVYNSYTLTTGDPAYEAQREDLQVLYRPLFITSFTIAEQLADGGAFGAETVVLSSASSKTAYGTAALLHDAGTRVVGLTSPANLEFTQALGCYDEVLEYGQLDRLHQVPTAYVDMAGSVLLRERLHAHLREQLVLDLIVGVTHQDTGRAGELQGAKPTLFFAPEVIRRRTAEWGRAGFDQRFGAAWQRFVPSAEQWVDVVPAHGPQALKDVWSEMVAGRPAPREGHVLTF